MTSETTEGEVTNEEKERLHKHGYELGITNGKDIGFAAGFKMAKSMAHDLAQNAPGWIDNRGKPDFEQIAEAIRSLPLPEVPK